MVTGKFMKLQHLSVNDGEGIRTIVFFGKCPLRCDWCANPESLVNYKTVAFYRKACIGCGSCVRVCPEGVGIDLNTKEDRMKCTDCGKCIEICPSGARQRLVDIYSVEDIIQEIQKQKIFYRFSNGGVTFSGGEPTYQLEALKELTRILYDKGYNLAIETSGYFNFERIKNTLKMLDLIFIDIKHFNSESHKKFTGKDNKIILENLEKIGEIGIDTVVRIPLIENVNATEKNIIQTAKFVAKNFENPKIELLPYHEYGLGKYEALFLNTPSGEYGRPKDDKIESLSRLIEENGVKVVSYK